MTIDIEQLRKMLEAATPGPWWTDAKYNGREMGCGIIAARTDAGPLPGNPTRGLVAWATATLNTRARECEATARLIALAPDLARAYLDVLEDRNRLRDAGDALSFAAQTTGGTAGRDEGLVAAIEVWRKTRAGLNQEDDQ